METRAGSSAGVNTISADIDRIIKSNARERDHSGHQNSGMRKERAQSFTVPKEAVNTAIAPGRRLTQSHVFSKKPRQMIPATIPENAPATFTVEDELENDTRDSQRSHHSKRSNRSRSSRHHHNGVNNNGFEDDGRSSNRSSMDRTSSRNTSIRSLQVQREQYWCFSKWSPCEKRLGVSVAVLATCILILVIIVGVLASTNEESNNVSFSWMP